MTQVKSKSNQIYKLIDAISSGVSALTEAELNSIGEEINSFLRKSIEFFHPAVLKNWTEFMETGLESDMLRAIALRLEPDLFFRFGKILEQQFNIEPEDAVLKEAVYHYLNVFRQSGFLKNIYNQTTWEKLIFDLIEKSNYHLGILFKQRVKEYGQKALFNVIKGNKKTRYSWTDTFQKIKEHALSLEYIARKHGKQQFKTAFLMENNPEMVFLDLACLTNGFINIMIPANSVPQHIEFILNQTNASLLFISDDKQLSKIKLIRKKIKNLKLIVLLSGSSIEDDVITFSEFKKYSLNLEEKTIPGNEITINQLATIMYTSGTTGDPKGIMFSQMNLVYKRFCRAMALPEIGSNDRFLSYLPLYHTFGRYLEMVGTVFWGAEYNFMENPARDTMLENMQLVKPTVFISIPKKWLELHQFISSKVDLEFDDQEKINRVTQNTTGAALKWGLSAAGFLDPEVFAFFQKNGIELMSGFGMTEATGGITMTPPGKYKENSLGKPLPGIDVKLADDGEMMIRGPYVMIDYYDGEDNVSKDPHKWFATGDIMQQDADGFYEIIDRKKEIYKNIKGETIAPQKIENYFRDFEYVEQVFLAGDHRPYNTVLIYANTQSLDMNETEINDYFSSVVVTVNNFLAPFERIIDFRLTNRPFSDKYGELTAKGTYKRRVIEKNFDVYYEIYNPEPYDLLINEMYQKTFISLSWQNLELKIPNWFLREKGCLTNDIMTTEHGLEIPKYKNKLSLKYGKQNGKICFKIGSYFYTNIDKKINFQTLIANPLYWLGNREILDFTGESIYQWYRLDEPDKHITFSHIDIYSKPNEKEKKRLEAILSGSEYSLEGLHLAVLLIQSEDEDLVLSGLKYLDYILSDPSLPLYELTCTIMQRPKMVLNHSFRKAFMLIGLPHIKPEKFKEYLIDFILVDSGILDSSIVDSIIKIAKQDAYLEGIGQILKYFVHQLNPKDSLDETPIPDLFNLLANYGINHPTRYKKIRQLIVRYQLYTNMPDVANEARKARLQLLKGFRHWLGENQKVAVDVETGEEYQWTDVISFEEGIS